MNTQHTVGPWKLYGKKDEETHVIDSNGWTVAWATAQFDRREAIENARLIAAAPDLLAALIDAENMLDQLGHTRVLENDTWDAIDKTVDKARAAIAKAEGA